MEEVNIPGMVRSDETTEEPHTRDLSRDNISDDLVPPDIPTVYTVWVIQQQTIPMDSMQDVSLTRLADLFEDTIRDTPAADNDQTISFADPVECSLSSLGKVILFSIFRMIMYNCVAITGAEIVFCIGYILGQDPLLQAAEVLSLSALIVLAISLIDIDIPSQQRVTVILFTHAFRVLNIILIALSGAIFSGFVGLFIFGDMHNNFVSVLTHLFGAAVSLYLYVLINIYMFVPMVVSVLAVIYLLISWEFNIYLACVAATDTSVLVALFTFYLLSSGNCEYMYNEILYLWKISMKFSIYACKNCCPLIPDPRAVVAVE